MPYKILVSKGARNDATSYYIDIIRDGIRESGNECDIIDSYRGIKKKDIVITVSARVFFYLCLVKPFTRKMNWFQGIMPEEILLLTGSKRKARIRAFYEWFTLRISLFNFFVSRKMAEHYKEKYNYTKGNYFLMPCFNKELNTAVFPEKEAAVKDQTVFLYAGGLSKWQCIDETLEIYKAIEDRLKNTQLLLLTPEVEKGKQMVAQAGIRNSIVKYVTLKEIDKEMLRAKYGFLIRKDDPINNVATPTKMNTYMANGVIPIISDVVYDFKENMLQSDHILFVRGEKSAAETAEEIVSFDCKSINYTEIRDDFARVFNKYYNRDHYVRTISGLIKEKNVHR
jgi:hypothetical protein